jgi:hypothetical protein
MRCVTLVVWLAFGLDAVGGVLPPNKLPAIAEKAITAPEAATLYSLEPEDYNKPGAKFHQVHILGKTTLSADDARKVGAQFKLAVDHWDGMLANCFNPRHGLRITYQHHVFDFVLCYECHQMEVFEDDKDIADLGAAGSADVLNGLLKAKHMPLSYVYSDAYLNEQAAEQKKSDDDWHRWIAAVPKAMHAFVPQDQGEDPFRYFPNDHHAQLNALARVYPSKTAQIRALLAWYGTDSGKWTGYPTYEDIPMRILLTYSTADCLTAIRSAPMTDAEWEGAARFFASWDFKTQRPHDLEMIPRDLKKKLLDRSLQNADEDKAGRAREAFQ